MIDKLEVRVEPEVPFTREFDRVYRAIGRKAFSKYYKEKIDLRPYGCPAVLFLHCRYNATHKLAFLETAQMSIQQIVVNTENIFDCESNELRIGRIDFAVDIEGIPMDWFRNHARVPYKRCRREIGTEQSGRTVYFGRGNDFIRIYDKKAEREGRRKTPAFDSKPCQGQSFEEHPAASGGANTITRVERQVRSGRIPAEVGTLGILRRNVAQFNPFSSVQLLAGGRSEPDFRSYRVSRFLEGKGLRQLVLEKGLAEAYVMLNGKSGGNASRIFRRLQHFLPPDPVPFKLPNLFAMYKKSVRPQLSFRSRSSPDPKFWQSVNRIATNR